jgi:hypothetical protein
MNNSNNNRLAELLRLQAAEQAMLRPQLPLNVELELLLLRKARARQQEATAALLLHQPHLLQKSALEQLAAGVARPNNNPIFPQQEAQLHYAQRIRTMPMMSQKVVPTDQDVLCGKGGRTLLHNRHFLQLCANFAEQYSGTTKRGMAGKRGIALKIIKEVRDGGGRFLKPHRNNKGWEVITDEASITKVGHCIRDMARKTRNDALNEGIDLNENENPE